MNTIYNQEYYEKYDMGDAGASDYKSNQALRGFFVNVARAIVDTFHPSTVLDAGCALGFLVEELRKLGVQAYGIDISEYAISQVDESVKEFCAVCPIQNEFPPKFPKHFDLITNIEVMEHLTKEGGEAAIRNLCAHTDRILFSSSSTDFEDPTHINVNTVDYWAAEFAKNGFFNRINNLPAFISQDAYCFEKETAASAVFRYKQKLLNLTEEVQKLSFSNVALEKDLQKTEKARQSFEKKAAELETHYLALSSQHQEILSSQYWRMTAPLRKITGAIKRVLLKFTVTRYLCKGIKSLLKNGIRTTFVIAGNKIKSKKPFDYSKITKKRREREENTAFDRDIKFSILVPLYNTPLKYLKEMIASVQAQTYKNWELCLADGSDAQHTEVEACARQYAKNDGRIVYKKLEKNMGISENTNRCLEMATGEYIALFDHDDVLHPSVLFENMRAICAHDADFLYTDEATFEGENITKIITFHFKPDFAIDNLRANNYICHFSVFARKLVEEAGLFRSAYDGSQDHDMILRLTARAKKVYHIRKLLYFWRSHPNSVALDIGSKTYAIDAGKNAVKESLKEAGYNAAVESSPAFPTIYRIKYELPAQPLLSVVIPSCDHKNDLEKCVNSILEKSTYPNYEIIIVENGSTQAETFEYYKQLAVHSHIRITEYTEPFNYSAVNNFGVSKAKGEYIILLNNDTEVITPQWMEELLMYAQRPDVGAVGAKLYYADDTIQHAGIVLGLGAHGIAGHSHYNLPKSNLGYMGKLYYAQNVSAVTGACMMVRRSLFEEIGGLDESLKIAFNDVDLCLKLREKGYLVVFTPYAELYHYESKTRGLEDTEEKKARFNDECHKFRKKWKTLLEAGDPYYNPNFSLKNDYMIEFSKLKSDCRQ